LTELLTKPLAGRKAVDNTKIMHFSQSLLMDIAVFLYLKLEVYQGGDDGEFDMFG
jgi:hypothetical protein